MSVLNGRRHFLQAALAGACTLAAGPVRAAESKVYFGLDQGHPAARFCTAVLKELQGRYTPDLGPSLTYVTGESATRCMDATSKSATDGSAVLYSGSGNLTLLPHVRSLPILAQVGNFVPVAPLLETTLVFVVGSAVPKDVRTMADYLRWVGENPLFGNYGVRGLGTPAHMVGVSMARVTNVNIKPLAYQSAMSMRREVRQGALGGAFMLAADHTPEGPRNDSVRVIAVTSPRRWSSLPDVPTLREQGLTEVDATQTFGFLMPPGTSPEKARDLNVALQQVLGSPALAALLIDGLQRSSVATPQDYLAALTQERAVWKVAVTKENFRVLG